MKWIIFWAALAFGLLYGFDAFSFVLSLVIYILLLSALVYLGRGVILYRGWD